MDCAFLVVNELPVSQLRDAKVFGPTNKELKKCGI